MSRPQSYQYVKIGTYDLASGGYTDEWETADFTIVGLQFRVTGADAADGKMELQESINAEDFDTYDAPVNLGIGKTTHSWMVGVSCSRYVRVLITPGSNTVGTVEVWGYGKL